MVSSLPGTRSLIAAAAFVAVAGSVAFAQQQNTGDATIFAKKVAASNAFEIQSSQLANDRAERDEVKTFAKKMIDDHTKSGQEFKAAVKSADVAAPPEEPDVNQKQTLSRLQQVRGKSFDDQYMGAQLKAHQEAVALFKSYSAQGKSAPLKDFAQKTLPTLEHHLQMAQDVSGQRTAARQDRPENKKAASKDAGPRSKAGNGKTRVAESSKTKAVGSGGARKRVAKATKKKRHASVTKKKKRYASRKKRYAYREASHCWCPCVQYHRYSYRRH
jgi:putative membrane protein